MRLTSNFIDNYIEKFNCIDQLEIDYSKIDSLEADAFKNCRNRKIKSFHLQTKTNEETRLLIPLYGGKHSTLFEPLKEHLEELYLSFHLLGEFNFLERLTNLRKLSLCRSDFRRREIVF